MRTGQNKFTILQLHLSSAALVHPPSYLESLWCFLDACNFSVRHVRCVIMQLIHEGAMLKQSRQLPCTSFKYMQVRAIVTDASLYHTAQEKAALQCHMYTSKRHI